MEATIYKIEINQKTGVIYEMTTRGEILSDRDVTVKEALSFARMRGLSFMENDGEVKSYW